MLAGLGALLTGPSLAAACSCAPPPAPEVALQGAGAVFEGTVVGIPAAPTENEPMGFGPVEYRFNVAQSWKGNVGMEARVTTNSSGAACGRKYSKGETYIVYGTVGDDGMVRDSLCSRTRTRENAADDLAALGAGVVPHSRGGVRPGPGPSGTDAVPPTEPTEPPEGGTAAAAVAAAEGTQPADAVDPSAAEPIEEASAEVAAEVAAEATTKPAAASKAASKAANEDEDKLPRENCSLSSADVSNTLGLVMLTGLIVAFRRRVGL